MSSEVFIVGCVGLMTIVSLGVIYVFYSELKNSIGDVIGMLFNLRDTQRKLNALKEYELTVGDAYSEEQLKGILFSLDIKWYALKRASITMAKRTRRAYIFTVQVKNDTELVSILNLLIKYPVEIIHIHE